MSKLSISSDDGETLAEFASEEEFSRAARSVSNVSLELKDYTKRRRNLETEKRAVADAIKDLRIEFKDKLTPDEIAAGNLAAKREHEAEEKRARRERVEQLALAL